MAQIITNNSGGGGGGNLDKYVANIPYECWEGEERAIAGDAVYEKVSAMETEIDGKQDEIADLQTIRDDASAGKAASDTISTYGNIVTHNANEFATSAQGALADTAMQPGDNISELANDSGFITSEDLPDLTPYQLKSNMVTSLNSADDTHYPTAKAVKDAISASGGGDVSGPSSSTDGHLAVFDGNTGKIIKDGGAIPTPTTVVDNLNSTSTTSALSANQGRVLNNSISTINGKIPSAATTSNQLADKQFVNDAINSVSAYYITKNAAGDQFATYAELAAATVFYSGGVVRTPTKNDYTIVLDDETHNDEVTRYIYNNGWEYQYTINESPLTQAQLNALNSGITSAKVSQYDGYASTISGKQDKLVSGTNIKTVNGTSILGSGDIETPNTTYSDATQSVAGLMSASDKTKLDGIEAQAQKNTITGVKGDAESTYRIGNVNITKANIGLGNVDNTSDMNKPISTATQNALNQKQAQHSSLTATLTSAGWSNSEQTVSVSGVTASNTVIVSPNPSSMSAYTNAKVFCSAQGSNSLTFSCTDTPAGDIVVNVVILN